MAKNFTRIGGRGLTLPPQSADPTNPAEGDEFYSDGTVRLKGIWVYQDGQWVRSGGGAGAGSGSFKVFNADDDPVSDWTKGNDATWDNGGAASGTMTEETAAPFEGDKSFKITQGAASLNDWHASPEFDIPLISRGKECAVVVPYLHDGADDDWKVVVKDITNDKIISSELALIKNAEGVVVFAAYKFNPLLTTLKLKFGFHCLSTNNTKELIFDRVYLTDDWKVVASLSNDTDTTEYALTASNTQGFGTPTGVNVYYNRRGDKLEMWGVFNAGTPTADTAEIDIPNGGVVKSGMTQQAKGTWFKGASSANAGGTILVTGGTTIIRFSSDKVFSDTATNSQSTANGDAIVTVGQGVMFFVTIPIEGWTAQTEHVITPVKSNIEKFHIDGYDSKDGSDYILFDQAHTTGKYSSTLSELLVEQTAGHTRLTALKKCLVFATYSARENNVGSAVAFIAHYNSSDVELDKKVVTLSQDEYDEATVCTIMEKDDYIVCFAARALEDASATNLTVLAVDFEQQLLSAIPERQVAYVKDVKADGVPGGTFNNGAWRTRDLNTLEGNTSFISLNANRFTVSPGIYSIDGNAPASQVDGHQSKLVRDPGGTPSDEIIGSVSDCGGATIAMTDSVIKGQIIITQETTFELQHQCGASKATTGFGYAIGFSVGEVYSQIKVEKLA